MTLQTQIECLPFQLYPYVSDRFNLTTSDLVLCVKGEALPPHIDPTALSDHLMFLQMVGDVAAGLDQQSFFGSETIRASLGCDDRHGHELVDYLIRHVDPLMLRMAFLTARSNHVKDPDHVFPEVRTTHPSSGPLEAQ